MGGSQKFTYDLFQYLYVERSPPKFSYPQQLILFCMAVERPPPKFSYPQQLILFCMAVERQTMRKTILFSHPAKTSIESYFNLINHDICSVYINSRF